LYILNKNSLTVKNIGYNLSAGKTAVFICAFLLIASIMYVFTEISLKNLGTENVNHEELHFAPLTSADRLFWVFTCFTAGFCEELVYRGFIINSLVWKGMNKYISVVVASLPFVLIHGLSPFMSLGNFFFYFVAGLVFGLIFIFTKRLWIPMIIHMVFNLFQMMAVL